MVIKGAGTNLVWATDEKNLENALINEGSNHESYNFMTEEFWVTSK